MTMGRRILVISDLHLGRGGDDVPKALTPVFAETDELIVNGDLAELHLPRHRDAALRGLEAMRARADATGVRLTLVAGNHDPGISPNRCLFLADGKVFLTHGDVVHPSLAPWSPAAAMLQEEYIRNLEAIPLPERGRLDSVLAASRDAAAREWNDPKALRRSGQPLRLLGRPLALMRIALFWREYPGLVADFALRHAPAAEFVLVGHSHRPGAWRLGNRTILNTGSFKVPHRPHVAIIEDRAISLRRIAFRDRFYELAPPRSEWCWELPRVGASSTGAQVAARTREGNPRPRHDASPREALATPAASTPVAIRLRSQR